MKKTVLFILAFFCITFSFAQTRLEGIVTYASNQSPIPYVSISTADGKAGSVSNSDGHFLIAVNTFPVTLVFSHVNFGKTEVTFSNASQGNVTLKPLSIELPEVNINASDPVLIVSKVYDKLTKSNSKVIANGFYRQWTRNDDIYSEFIESFYTTRIGATGVEQAMITQGRYARKLKGEGLITNNNFSAFTNTFPLAMTAQRSFLSPICADAENYFTLTLSERIKDTSGKVIYVITFSPLATNTLPGFSGKLFINEDDDLIRFKGTISDARFNPIETITDKVTNVKLEIDAFCDNEVANVLLLENLKADLTYTYKYDGKNTRQVHSSSFYFVYDYDTSKINRELTVDKNANDYQAIHNGQYDESFWEKKQVLSQTPVEKEIIKQFRKSNEFKKVFLK